MSSIRERSTSVLDDQAVEFANMRVPDRGGNAAVGHNAGKQQLFDSAFSQHPLETGHVERRVGNLLDCNVRRRERVDQLLAPAAWRKVALGQKWPQRLEVRRDDRLAVTARDEREQRRNNENAAVAGSAHEGREPIRQRRDRRTRLAGAAVGAVAMQEIVLQVAENERGCGWSDHVRSTIRLPIGSIRPANPGSMAVVASACSRIAGPSITAPAGNSSRAQMSVSRHPPSNHTGRDPNRAAARDVDALGAKTEKSNAGRQPIAATRSVTVRIGIPGKSRLNEPR